MWTCGTRSLYAAQWSWDCCCMYNRWLWSYRSAPHSSRRHRLHHHLWLWRQMLGLATRNSSSTSRSFSQYTQEKWGHKWFGVELPHTTQPFLLCISLGSTQIRLLHLTHIKPARCHGTTDSLVTLVKNIILIHNVCITCDLHLRCYNTRIPLWRKKKNIHKLKGNNRSIILFGVIF